MNSASSVDQPSGDGPPQRSTPRATTTTAARGEPRVGASAVRRSAGEPGQKPGSSPAIASGMLFRSTGLGKAELVASITSLRSQGDYLIMEMETTEPVRWRIRGGVSHHDIRRIMRLVFTRSVLRFFLDPRLWFKKPGHPGDF